MILRGGGDSRRIVKAVAGGEAKIAGYTDWQPSP